MIAGKEGKEGRREGRKEGRKEQRRPSGRDGAWSERARGLTNVLYLKYL